MSIKEKVTTLADARKKEALIRASVASTAAAINEFLETVGLTPILEGERAKLSEAMVATSQAYNAVRAEALALFEQDGNKLPHPAVTVKIFTTFSYDLETAFKYCQQYLKKAIVLNQKAFEKAAKTAGLDFVELGIDPRPNISKKMSKWESDE